MSARKNVINFESPSRSAQSSRRPRQYCQIETKVSLTAKLDKEINLFSRLRSRQNATETVSTQITPAVSRLDNEQSKNPDHMLRVAEFQSQQIDISVRKVHLALDQGAKEEASLSEKLSDLDCSDEENFIEPLVLNSAKEISEASKSTSNPLRFVVTENH
jgi:predicted transcriptional regulator